MRKLFLLLFSLPMFGQGNATVGTVQSPKGQALAGQTVALCTQPANTNTTPCSPLANTYTSSSLSVLSSTPGLTTTDVNGNYKFYAASGLYTLQYYGPQVSTPVVITDFPVFGTSTPTITLKKGSGAGNYSGTNTSFANVDATNLSYTVTIPVGWKLAVFSTGSFIQNTAAGGIIVEIADGGTPIIPQIALTPASTTSNTPYSIATVINGDGNSHTVTLVAATSNASDAWVLINSAATLAPTMVFLLTPSN